jgi:mono/diheme cytochrome c family protein
MRFPRVLLPAFAITVLCPMAIAANVPAVYTKECVACHGADGRGKTPYAAKVKIPDLRSKEMRSKSNTELFETIARGTEHRAYPHAYIYRGVQATDIDDLVKFIRTLQASSK